MIVLASHWSEMINTELLLADHQWPRPPRYDIIWTQHPDKNIGDKNQQIPPSIFEVRGNQNKLYLQHVSERLEQCNTAYLDIYQIKDRVPFP